MRKNSNSGSARGGVGIYRCYLCKGDEEESTNHILLHCSKVAMLSQLILLAWSFCRKEKEDGVKSDFFVFILDLMEGVKSKSL